MKKSDLKDGYLLTLQCGSRFYVCGKFGLHNSEPDPLWLEKFNDDLTYQPACDPPQAYDVVEVCYSGVSLWRRN